VLWDDNAHLTRRDLQSTGGLARIWFDVGATQQYYPLAHSAFWTIHRVAGDDTVAYHAINIALHSLSAFLVALLFRRLRIPGAVVGGVIFALHPMQVESVAWMTELKNTLSGALALGAALAYLRFDDTRRPRPYIAAALLFAGALLTKSVTSVLPAALLIIFWWQRGTIAWRRDVFPLLPFFGAGLAMGITTAWFERVLNGARGVEFHLSPLERVLVAGRALWFYVWTFAWPSGLSFVYPKWTVDPRVWWQYLFPLGALAVAGLLWHRRSIGRGLPAAALLYAAALAPALGFIDVYPFRFSYVADHFAYLAIIPLAALASAALVDRLARWLPARRAEAALALGLGMVLAAMTWTTAKAYSDGDTLYRVTLERNPACWLCHNNLATPLLSGTSADLDVADAHLAAALRLNPDYAEAHNNLGGVLQRRGRLEEARREHEQAFRLNPDLVEALYNVALCEQALGRVDDAIAHYTEAVRRQPDYVQAHYNLGTALQAAGRLDEAAAAYRAALAIAPALGEAHCALGTALAIRGQTSDAVTELRACARLLPGSADTHYRLAILLATSNRTDEAVGEFREALRLDPSSAQVHHDLGAALANLGRLDEAVAEFKEALRLQPDYQDARASLTRAERMLSLRQ
jgi:tetratricopeptide (TPR) repeat protein